MRISTCNLRLSDGVLSVCDETPNCVRYSNQTAASRLILEDPMRCRGIKKSQAWHSASLFKRPPGLTRHVDGRHSTRRGATRPDRIRLVNDRTVTLILWREGRSATRDMTVTDTLSAASYVVCMPSTWCRDRCRKACTPKHCNSIYSFHLASKLLTLSVVSGIEF